MPAALVQKTGPAHEASCARGWARPTAGPRSSRSAAAWRRRTTSVQRRDARGRTGTLDATIVSGPRGQVFLLGRVARDGAAMDRARPALREAELSFRSMSAADRVAARPWHLNIVPTRPAASRSLHAVRRLTELPEQQLRLLNGVYGGHADPRPGQLVKVVE